MSKIKLEINRVHDNHTRKTHATITLYYIHLNGSVARVKNPTYIGALI